MINKTLITLTFCFLLINSISTTSVNYSTCKQFFGIDSKIMCINTIIQQTEFKKLGIDFIRKLRTDNNSFNWDILTQLGLSYEGEIGEQNVIGLLESGRVVITSIKSTGKWIVVFGKETKGKQTISLEELDLQNSMVFSSQAIFKKRDLIEKIAKIPLDLPLLSQLSVPKSPLSY